MQFNRVNIYLITEMFEGKGSPDQEGLSLTSGGTTNTGTVWQRRSRRWLDREDSQQCTPSIG